MPVHCLVLLKGFELYNQISLQWGSWNCEGLICLTPARAVSQQCYHVGRVPPGLFKKKKKVLLGSGLEFKKKDSFISS